MKTKLLCLICFFFVTTVCFASTAVKQSSANLKTYVTIMLPELTLAEVSIEKNQITGLKKVLKQEHPERTISFELIRTDDDKRTVLKITNPLDKPIKYSIDIMAPNGELYPTSSCPVPAGKSTIELWPYLFPGMVVKNVHFLAETEAGECSN